MDYSDVCKTYECKYFIIWEYQIGAKCESCKKIGQSEIIDIVPADCPYIEEMKKIQEEEDNQC